MNGYRYVLQYVQMSQDILQPLCTFFKYFFGRDHEFERSKPCPLSFYIADNNTSVAYFYVFSCEIMLQSMKNSYRSKEVK